VYQYDAPEADVTRYIVTLDSYIWYCLSLFMNSLELALRSW